MQRGDKVRILVNSVPGRKSHRIRENTIGWITEKSSWYRVEYLEGNGTVSDFWFPESALSPVYDMELNLDFSFEEIEEAEDYINGISSG